MTDRVFPPAFAGREQRPNVYATLGQLPVVHFRVDHAELATQRQHVEDQRAAKANRKPKHVAPLDAGGRRHYAQQLRRTLEMCV